MAASAAGARASLLTKCCAVVALAFLVPATKALLVAFVGTQWPCSQPPRLFQHHGVHTHPSRSLSLVAAAVPANTRLAFDAGAAAAAAEAAARNASRHDLELRMLAGAAATCRGQGGGAAARREVLELVEALELLNPTKAPAVAEELLQGDWRLVFASEDVTRSSPFFWAWRKLLEGVEDPVPFTRKAFATDLLSESIFAVTDGIPVKTIGEATQTITEYHLVNRVSLAVFGVGQTMMTTTCQRLPASEEAADFTGHQLSLLVETTQPANSTLPLADSFVFPSEILLGESALVTMSITFLDESLRVVRNAADDQVFVYVRDV